MSGPNPFDDLAEDDNDSDEDTEIERGVGLKSETKTDELDTDSKPSVTTETTTETKTGTSPAPERTNVAKEKSVEGPTLTNSSPPFPYSDAEQKQMYVQDGLWDDFEDLEFDAELELRRTFEVRNVEQRELDTAVIRLVLNRLTSREIAEKVIQMRGFDPSNFE